MRFLYLRWIYNFLIDPEDPSNYRFESGNV